MGRWWLGGVRGRVLIAGAGVVAAGVVLVGEGISRRLLANSLLLVAGTLAICLPAGIAGAVLLARTNLPARRLLAGALLWGLCLPLYLQACAWQAGFGVLGAFTTGGTTPLLDGARGAIWVHGVAAIPWVVAIVGHGLRCVTPELEEAALLSWPAWQVVGRVTLRRVLPSIAAAALWVAVWTAGEMTVADLFMFDTFARHVYNQASLGDTPRDIFLAHVPLLGLVAWLLVATLAGCHALLRHAAPPPARGPVVFSLGRWRFVAGLVAAAGTFVVIGVPLVNLVYRAGIDLVPTATGLSRQWSWRRCGETLRGGVTDYLPDFRWTLLIGLVAAAAAVAAAIPLAWWARRGGAKAIPGLLAVAAGAGIPAPLVGLVLIAALNRPALAELYDHSILAPALAQVIRTLPVVWVVLWSAFRHTPQELLDLAAVDGFSPAARLVRVVLPLHARAIALAMTAGMIVATGELGATILVLPPGVRTVPQQIFSQLHWTAGDSVAGIALVSAACYAVLAGLAAWLAARRAVG